MTSTSRIGLHVTPAEDSTKRFQDWRVELSGDGPDSNMVIIDTEIGKLHDKLLSNEIDLTPYAKTDETDKKIADAVSESTEYTDAAANSIRQTYNPLIPFQASEVNQLADKNFVNSSIQHFAANRVTYDAAGNQFPTRASLLNATIVYYQGSEYTPTKNDYCYITADEGAPAPFTNGQTRFDYDSAQWVYGVGINEKPFTSEEVAALGSGITAALVSKVANPDTVPTQNSEGLVGSGGVFGWFGGALSTLKTAAKTLIGAINEVRDSIVFHIDNSTSHVSTTDRSSWNAKLSTAPVTSVNGKTGAVSLSAADVSAKPSTYKPFAASTTAPSDTTLLWIDTANGSILKYHNGSSWVTVSASWG